jgi:hypothetical protein
MGGIHFIAQSHQRGTRPELLIGRLETMTMRTGTPAFGLIHGSGKKENKQSTATRINFPSVWLPFLMPMNWN